MSSTDSRKEPTEENEGPVDPAIFDRPDVQAKIARALKATAPTEPTEEELADAMDDQADALDRVKPGHLVATDDAVVLLRAAAAEIRRLIEALRSSRAENERQRRERDDAWELWSEARQRVEELERAAGQYVEVRRIINKNSGSGSKWDHREARKWADKSAAAFEALRQALHHTPKEGE